jgi:3-methylcrotonyl-CoA carboxylase alpha subunit
MPAMVRQVLVIAGDVVSRGDALVVLEAMKMEQRMTAPRDGVVKSVNCAAGQSVERGQVLVEFQV